MTGTSDDRRSRGVMVALVVVVVAVAGLLLFLVLRDNEDDAPQGSETADATTETTPTTAAVTSSAMPTATISAEEAVGVVWPAPEGELRYRDPLGAVRGFAEDLVGFSNPIYGSYLSGDARSGEVEIRAGETGPATTVLVRQLSDDHWWVLGAATEDIVLDEPAPGTAIDDPVQLSGQASAFEGTVQVSVFTRGATVPAGEGFVTASGSGELGPFEGDVRWDNPGGGWGVVLLYTVSAEDGRVVQATAIPVGFIGGD